MYTLSKAEIFDRSVLSKFHVYNSVFLTLPFDEIGDTGSLLPLFSEVCEKGFSMEKSPMQIVDFFFDKYLNVLDDKSRLDLLFRFIQYVERQIVLFDAIEDAAFPLINNLEGKGSLREVKENSEAISVRSHLQHFLQEFNVRPVLTAHPTQFYPGSVLGIITDLTKAISEDNLYNIKQLLSQLGKTPFIKKEKTTPFDEAVSLTWYLENVFYQTAGEMLSYIRKAIFDGAELSNPILSFGFWPGGDRDGNPFVTTAITLKVANRLRTSILKRYYADIRILKRKLTFSSVDFLITAIEEKIYRAAYYADGEIDISIDELKERLQEIKSIIINQHQSLHLDAVEAFIDKVNLFGFYFATLDLRQNSKIHDNVFVEITNKLAADIAEFPKNYVGLTEDERIAIWTADSSFQVNASDFDDELTQSTLESIDAMREIQRKNGELGANRYIISNNESALHVIETLALFRLSGWENPSVDIVPLLEIIDDLEQAAEIMEKLYTNAYYKSQLQRRNNKQTVMLGFSDGTKDGGYLMANWSIYRAKKVITEVSRKHGIKVVFFDGRGGPPARGGGKTHQFYASLGAAIENKEIELTVQGQTISSNFGTNASCRYNLENLISAGITNEVFNKGQNQFSNAEEKLIEELSEIGYTSYTNFKNHPKFIPYLEEKSTLRYYAKANIGSRPAKRGQSDALVFSDLRAIPFVGSWSQLKQNVPGFFGVGSALSSFERSGKWDSIKKLYDDSLFFRTLLENSMMSLSKCFFPLTAYMKDDPEFGDFWKIIYSEFLLTEKMLLKIAGHSELMENYPDGKASIAVRESIVLPLLVIQQYALVRISELNKAENPDLNLIVTYEKLVTRSLFGNTNASRNSA